MNNWLWIALGVGALALFAFGRAGCGMGHGGHDHGRRDEEGQDGRPRETTAGLLSTSAARADAGTTAGQPPGHVHGAPSGSQQALATEHAGHGSDPTQAESRRHRHGC